MRQTEQSDMFLRSWLRVGALVLAALFCVACGAEEPAAEPAPELTADAAGGGGGQPDAAADDTQTESVAQAEPVEAEPPTAETVPVAEAQPAAPPTNLLAMVEGTEVNSFVIDLKDATGYVSHRSSVPTVAEIGADKDRRIGNLHTLLWRMKEAGIYPIARIVIMKDPKLSDAFPDMAVQDTAGGPWVDGKGQVWLNPFDRDVWDYHLALGREAVEAGFPEIQWDYVRFPDAPRSEIERTVYPGRDGQTRSAAIRAFLSYTRDELGALGVSVTADVFGVTTSASRDVGIGQVWEEFIDVVDVALPMVYPSHYWKGSFGFDTPNAYPYEIVYEALIRAQRRTAAVEGAGTVRPWLQDFSLGKPRYGAPHVRAQIQATYDAGISEWILWNPGGRYSKEALAPAGGYAEGAEPLIPVADSTVVASEAMAFLQATREAKRAAKAAAEAEAAAIKAAEEAAAADPGVGEAAADTTGTGNR